VPWESVIVASKTLSVDIFWLFSVCFFEFGQIAGTHDFLRNLLHCVSGTTWQGLLVGELLVGELLVGELLVGELLVGELLVGELLPRRLVVKLLFRFSLQSVHTGKSI
jgi:uncharacterized membrane protein